MPVRLCSPFGDSIDIVCQHGPGGSRQVERLYLDYPGGNLEVLSVYSKPHKKGIFKISSPAVVS